MSYHDQNIGKINELLEPLRWPCTQFMDKCLALGLEFQITESFRSQKRQDQLYSQGRTKPGNIVTWTRRSKHTERVAMDLYPLWYKDRSDQLRKLTSIASVALKYGIIRPPELLKLGDYGHFDVQGAKPVVRKPVTIGAKLRGLKNRLKNEEDDTKRATLQRQIDALERRL